MWYLKGSRQWVSELYLQVDDVPTELFEFFLLTKCSLLMQPEHLMLTS